MSQPEKRFCTKCEKDKRKVDFYVSYSPIHNGYVPICKTCLQNNVDVSDLESVQDMLRMIDRPYIEYVWKAAIQEGRSVFGTYMKNINMRQFRNLTWKDSIFSNENQALNGESNSEIESFDNLDSFQFNVSSDMIKKWGKNFEPEDYFQLEDFYNKMMTSNKIETPQEETYLKKLAVISLKMDKELEKGNYSQVKQLGDLFSKYMADSKFRAMDQTDASKTGGLRTFSQIYAEVEQDGFIPPWEEYRQIRGLEQDIVDKTIMHILNYTLKLNKMSSMTTPPTDTPKVSEDRGDEDES